MKAWLVGLTKKKKDGPLEETPASEGAPVLVGLYSLIFHSCVIDQQAQLAIILLIITSKVQGCHIPIIN